MWWKNIKITIVVIIVLIVCIITRTRFTVFDNVCHWLIQLKLSTCELLINFYHQQMWHGNAFSRICLSVCLLICLSVCVCLCMLLSVHVPVCLVLALTFESRPRNFICGVQLRYILWTSRFEVHISRSSGPGQVVNASTYKLFLVHRYIFRTSRLMSNINVMGSRQRSYAFN